ncbi:hypothetical protein NDU88_000876 [Pleurodeles waltl]|uniref:Uncharacterized protein n=1 Tax=Pleurodeles waltl TaxID=8319 RepID=A0AAV7Q4D9_PLEWA|nr:hypothetical protein NDU88_000876 [Pleurodeles waltl]
MNVSGWVFPAKYSSFTLYRRPLEELIRSGRCHRRPLGAAWFGYTVRCGRMVVGQLREFCVRSRARGGRAHRRHSVDRLSFLLDQLFQFSLGWGGAGRHVVFCRPWVAQCGVRSKVVALGFVVQSFVCD